LICIRTTAFTFATCHQALSLLVLVDPLEQRPELAVPAGGHLQPHPLDGLARRQSGIELGLFGDRLLDALFGLLVERHRREPKR
jgi:hypothetical protein